MSWIRQQVAALVEALGDAVNVLRLRREVMRLRAARYQQAIESVEGLRRANATLRRAQESLAGQLDERDALIDRLRGEYGALEDRSLRESQILGREQREHLFEQLRPLLVQMPTLVAALEQGADVPAQSVLALLAPLEELVDDLGLERIGQASEVIGYDPTRHQPAGMGGESLSPGDQVRVRYVGYLLDGDVVCKAEVTAIHMPEAAGSTH